MSVICIGWQGDANVNVKEVAYKSQMTLRQVDAGSAMKGAQAVFSKPMAEADPRPPPVWNSICMSGFRPSRSSAASCAGRRVMCDARQWLIAFGSMACTTPAAIVVAKPSRTTGIP